MGGFEFFIFFGAAVILFVFLVSWLLRKKYPDKPYDVILGLGIISLGIIAIPYSLFVIGGWNGIGLGIMGITVIIAATIGMSINLVLKIFSAKK